MPDHFLRRGVLYVIPTMLPVFPANKSGTTKVFFQSTRGGVRGVSFEEAVLSGYAPDGGLLVPELVPLFTADQLRAMSRLSFAGARHDFAQHFYAMKRGVCTAISPR